MYRQIHTHLCIRHRVQTCFLKYKDSWFWLVEVGFKGQMQAYQLRQHMVSYNIATYTACMLWLWLKDIYWTQQIVNSRIEVVYFITDFVFLAKNHQKGDTASKIW
jgi:hypothetical protein